MANHQKVRSTYENLFQKLISTTKGNQKINNFIKGFKSSFESSTMLPLKIAEARVSFTVSSKAPAKKKAKTTVSKTSKTTASKRTTRKRKKEA